MAKLGEQPTIKYKKDGERYIVYLGDDRIGFVRQVSRDKWNAADTFMEKSADRSSRDAAGLWLKREFERAVKDGRI